jgi:hypothetical protein
MVLNRHANRAPPEVNPGDRGWSEDFCRVDFPICVSSLKIRGLKVMNSASQDFPHHLGVLRERMLHPTDYELAVNYFLEEFAGDAAFVRASDREKMPHLVAVLGKVVSKALGRNVEVEGALVSYLREYRFVHGNGQADGRIVLFFYFEDADTGMVMLIPGVRGEGEMARFHMTGGLPDPQLN